MPESISPNDVLVDVQMEAVKALAKGFDEKDSSEDGSRHRETLVALTRSVASADSSVIKVAVIQSIGDYATRNSTDVFSPYLRISSVQKEAVDAIATAAAKKDADLKVKDAGLDQVSRRLDMRDSSENGEIHGQAIDAILKIATSVVVNKDNPAAGPLVNKAIGLLSDYATRNSTDVFSPYLRISSVQEKAKGYIQQILTTVGVERFEDLNQQT